MKLLLTLVSRLIKHQRFLLLLNLVLIHPKNHNIRNKNNPKVNYFQIKEINQWEDNQEYLLIIYQLRKLQKKT